LFRKFAIGLQSLFRKNQVDRELDEELGAYLEMEAAEKMRQGVGRKDALREVRLERGSLEVTKELVRSGGWEFFVETCWQDLHCSVRMLRKSPGFAAVAIVTLALGIGANTAIFSLTDQILLRDLPVPHPEQLFILRSPGPNHGIPGAMWTKVRSHSPIRCTKICANGRRCFPACWRAARSR